MMGQEKICGAYIQYRPCSDVYIAQRAIAEDPKALRSRLQDMYRGIPSDRDNWSKDYQLINLLQTIAGNHQVGSRELFGQVLGKVALNGVTDDIAFVKLIKG
jgi:hypothetical protein